MCVLSLHDIDFTYLFSTVDNGGLIATSHTLSCTRKFCLLQRSTLNNQCKYPKWPHEFQAKEKISMKNKSRDEAASLKAAKYLWSVDSRINAYTHVLDIIQTHAHYTYTPCAIRACDRLTCMRTDQWESLWDAFYFYFISLLLFLLLLLLLCGKIVPMSLIFPYHISSHVRLFCLQMFVNLFVRAFVLSSSYKLRD